MRLENQRESGSGGESAGGVGKVRAGQGRSGQVRQGKANQVWKSATNEGQYYSYMALYIASADCCCPDYEAGCGAPCGVSQGLPLASGKGLSPIYVLYVRFPLQDGRAMGSPVETNPVLCVLGNGIDITYILTHSCGTARCFTLPESGIAHCPSQTVGSWGQWPQTIPRVWAARTQAWDYIRLPKSFCLAGA